MIPNLVFLIEQYEQQLRLLNKHVNNRVSKQLISNFNFEQKIQMKIELEKRLTLPNTSRCAFAISRSA